MSGLYKFLVLLHVLSVVIGIGAVFLNGMYANIAQKRQGAEGLAVSQANYDVSMVGEKFIYAIPVFGIGAVLASDDVWSFDMTWIWLSLVLYVVALGLSHSILIPGHRRLNELAAKLGSGQGGPDDVAEMQTIGKRMAPTGGTLNLIVVVLIALMIWKPGT